MNTHNDPKLIAVCVALLDAIEADRKTNYGAIDESWHYAINQMSDNVIDVWNEKTQAIYQCADELRMYLSEQSIEIKEN